MEWCRSLAPAPDVSLQVPRAPTDHALNDTGPRCILYWQRAATAIVARGGDVLFLGAAGLANVELGIPLDPDMVFEIGSITKQFTAAAIMMLAEDGKLSIEDPLSTFFPDYPNGNAVTVEGPARFGPNEDPCRRIRALTRLERREGHILR